MGSRGSSSGKNKKGGGGGGSSGEGQNIAPEKIRVEDVGTASLPSLTGTDKQVAWAEDIRKQWISDQNATMKSWGEEIPSLVEARAAAEGKAKAAGKTFQNGEGSDVYRETLVTEMKKRGFNKSYNDYMTAWKGYSDGSSITDLVPKPIQKKALKNMGLSSPPKTKDVNGRIKLFREAVSLYAGSEKKASRWIELRDYRNKRLQYYRGDFVPV